MKTVGKILTRFARSQEKRKGHHANIDELGDLKDLNLLSRFKRVLVIVNEKYNIVWKCAQKKGRNSETGKH